MKQDKLEKFVSENRQAFDEFEPSLQNWEQINKNIQPKKPNLFLKISWQVAAAIVIFVSSYYFHDYINNDKVYYANTVKQIKNVSIKIKQKTLQNNNNTIATNNNEIELKQENLIVTTTQKNNQKTENSYYSELNELSVYYTS